MTTDYEAMVKEKDEKIAELDKALTDDVSAFWRVTNAIKKIINAYEWITEGRGSYAYDDDRYRKETGYAFNEIRTLIRDAQKPASKTYNELKSKLKAQLQSFQSLQSVELKDGIAQIMALKECPHMPIDVVGCDRPDKLCADCLMEYKVNELCKFYSAHTLKDKAEKKKKKEPLLTMADFEEIKRAEKLEIDLEKDS